MSQLRVLEKQELLEITGGAISGTMINALVRGFSAIIDLGRSLGTAIRRIQTGQYCS